MNAPAAAAHLPRRVQLGYTAWMVFWVAVVLTHYGPQNFFWLCNISKFVLLVVVWGGHRLLLSSQAGVVLIVGAGWSLDFIIGLALGGSPTGFTAYMWSDELSLLARAVSLYHVGLPLLVLWLLGRIGYDRRGLWLQCAIGAGAVAGTWLLTEPARNINWMYAPFGVEQVWLPEPAFALLLVLAYPLVFYLPGHALVLGLGRARGWAVRGDAGGTARRIAVGAGLACGIGLAAFVIVDALSGAPTQWTPERIAAEVHGWGTAGPLLLAGVMAVVVVLPLPTMPVTMTAGLVYGPAWGALVAVAGALAGALAAFWIARLLGHDALRRCLPQQPVIDGRCSDRTLAMFVFGARLVPVVSFALVSYAAGLTAMRALPFALATLFGMLPMTVVYVMLGRAFSVDPLWAGVASAVVIVAMFALPAWLERRSPQSLARVLTPLQGRRARDDSTPGKRREPRP